MFLNVKYKSLLVMLVFALLLSSLAGSALPASKVQAHVVEPSLAAQTEEQHIYLPYMPTWSTKESVFGVEVHSISKYGGAYLMQDAGAFWFRLNGVLWSKVEPNPGDRNWDALADLSNQLKDAAARGMRVVLIVRGAPVWARIDPNMACSGIRPEYYEAFATFVQEVVSRYSKPPYNVQYFEMWNEPDVDPSLMVDGSMPYGCWGNKNDYYYGGESFGEMLKVVYPKIKDVNKMAQVVFGGLLLDCNPATSSCNNPATSRYLEGALRVGAGNAFDIVSFHGYDYFDWDERLGRYENPGWSSKWDTTGPVSIAKANFIRDVLNRYGVGNKPLINTETALITNHLPCSFNCEQTKVYYITQSYAAARSVGLLGNIWYSALGWRGSELIANDGTLTTEPSYNAYLFARKKLGPGTFSRQITEFRRIGGYEFYDGLQRWVLWAKNSEPQTIELPKLPIATYEWDAASSQYLQIPNKREVKIGLAPMYFEFNP